MTPNNVRRTARQLVLLGVLILMAVATAAAQENEQVPKALVLKTMIDVGTVTRGDKVDGEWEIENTGTAPLVIREVRKSCACTELSYDEMIAPGAKGKVKVTVDTTTFQGGQIKHVRVFTNDPTNPEINLTVRVDSAPVIAAVPGHVRYILVQGFREDSLLKQVLFIPGKEGGDFEIKSVDSPNPLLDVTFREAREEERDTRGIGRQWVVETRMDANPPVGPLSGYLTVHTDHPKQSRVPIALSGFVRPVFAVTPAEGDYGELDVEGEQDIVATHLIKRFHSDEIELLRVESDVAGIEPILEDAGDGRSHYLRLVFDRKMPKGPFEGAIVVHTSSDLKRKIEVPIRGTVLRAPHRS